jgi:hypothetical protein
MAGKADLTRDAKAGSATDASIDSPIDEVVQQDRDSAVKPEIGDGRTLGDLALTSERTVDGEDAAGDGSMLVDAVAQDVAWGEAADSPVHQDTAVPRDSGTASDTDLPPCSPTFPFSMPSDLAEVQETYDVCLQTSFPTVSDMIWLDHLEGWTLRFVQAHTCVDPGDSRIGTAIGSAVRMVLGVNVKSRVYPYTIPQRIYAIRMVNGSSEVRAAYDLSYLVSITNAIPAYPERYLRIDQVCGDPDAIPALNGWTGRIGFPLPIVLSTQPFLARYTFWLLGSAAGESTERALLYSVDLSAS